MKRSWVVVIVVLIILAGGGYYLMNNNQAKSPSPEETLNQNTATESISPSAAETIIALSEQNESSESGIAVLTENEGKVTVVLNMQGAPSGVPQPAHIHVGACPDVGAVEYPLTNVVDGQSETVLDVSMANLKAKLPLGINVHKSAAEAKVYVSCGDLSP